MRRALETWEHTSSDTLPPSRLHLPILLILSNSAIPWWWSIEIFEHMGAYLFKPWQNYTVRYVWSGYVYQQKNACTVMFPFTESHVGQCWFWTMYRAKDELKLVYVEYVCILLWWVWTCTHHSGCVIRGQPWVLVLACYLMCDRLAVQRAFGYTLVSISFVTIATLGLQMWVTVPIFYVGLGCLSLDPTLA